jgi:N-acetylglucosaminyldiphosphoundecaprenol N-acetyl-beta-D-mannosaminyltransferase
MNCLVFNVDFCHMNDQEKTSVLSRNITLSLDTNPAIALREFDTQGKKSAFFCNVHMLMESQEDEILASAMGAADYVFADGVPVAWLQSRLCNEPAKVIRGYEVMLYLCKLASEKGHKVGFLGSTDKVLTTLRDCLVEKFPSLEISYLVSPSFVEGELNSSVEEIGAINSAGLKYLFIGLGCPKQEKWIYRYANQLNCSLLAVGAAFEWLAGLNPMPPKWMENTGFGWLHRLLHQPRRMWRRYLIYNSKFIWAAAIAMLKK